MAMQIIIPVDKSAAREQISQLMTLLICANGATLRSTYANVSKARDALCMAKGMYHVLDGLDLIREQSTIGEDIARIEAKVQGIWEKKLREEYLK